MTVSLVMALRCKNVPYPQTDSMNESEHVQSLKCLNMHIYTFHAHFVVCSWVSVPVFWMSGLVFGMSVPVFWVSGFVFWVSGLVFRCLYICKM